MKIITVHGTFAADPQHKDKGKRWWQRGSDFSKAACAKLGVPPSNYIPFHWSGANSERGRRQAGRDLFKLLSTPELNNGEEKISIVSHSHGGNVVGHCFRYAARKNKPLRNVEDWVSVGTPFIRQSSSLLNYYNLGFITLPLILVSLYVIIYDGQGIWQAFLRGMPDFWDHLLNNGRVFLLVLAIMFLSFLAVSQYMSFRRNEKTFVDFIGFKPKILNHPSDEARFALRSIKNIRTHLRFTAVTRNLIYIAGFFLLSFYWLYADITSNTIGQSAYELIMGQAPRPLDEPLTLAFAASFLPSPIESSAIAGAFVDILSIAITFSGLLLLSWILAYLLAPFFDQLVSIVVKSRATSAVYGWDVTDAYVSSIGDEVTQDGFSKQLKMDVATEKEMVRVANDKLIGSAAEIRSLIASVNLGQTSLSQAQEKLSESDLQELIHNGYFENPDVIDLISNAIQ
ncbi:MAG: hypothetical protein AAFR71_03635 [Pseudomonadota bacterium]